MRQQLINSFSKGISPDLSPAVLPNDSMYVASNIELYKADGDNFVVSSHSGTNEVFILRGVSKPIATAQLGSFLFILSVNKEGHAELGTYPSPDWNNVAYENLLSSQSSSITIPVIKEYSPLRNFQKADNSLGFISTPLLLTNFEEGQLELSIDYDNTVNIYVASKGKEVKLVNSRFAINPSNPNEVIFYKSLKGLYKEVLGSSQFNLNVTDIKTPEISTRIIDSGGSLKEGLYTIYIKYSNEDFEETNIASYTLPIPITDQKADPSDDTLEKTVKKKILLEIKNLDTRFNYINIYVSIASGERLPASLNSYRVSGRRKITSNLMTVTIDDEKLFLPITNEEVALFFRAYPATRSIAQLDNRLWQANLSGEVLQDLYQEAYNYFSTVEVRTVNTVINRDYFKEVNNFNEGGYFNNELYPIGVSLLMNDNTFSPVFPIKGFDYTRVENDVMLGFIRPQGTSYNSDGTYNVRHLQVEFLTPVPENIKSQTKGIVFVRADRLRGYRICQGILVHSKALTPGSGYMPAPFKEISSSFLKEKNREVLVEGPIELFIRSRDFVINTGEFSGRNNDKRTALITLDTVTNPYEIQNIRAAEVTVNAVAAVKGIRIFPERKGSNFRYGENTEEFWNTASVLGIDTRYASINPYSKKYKMSYVYGFEQAFNDLSFVGAVKRGDNQDIELPGYIYKSFYGLDFEDYLGMYSEDPFYLPLDTSDGYTAENYVGIDIRLNEFNDNIFKEKSLGLLVDVYDENNFIKPEDLDYFNNFMSKDFFPVTGIIKWESLKTKEIIKGGDCFIVSASKRIYLDSFDYDTLKIRGGKCIFMVQETEYNPLFRKEEIVNLTDKNGSIGNARTFGDVSFRVSSEETRSNYTVKDNWLVHSVRRNMLPESTGFNKGLIPNGKSVYPFLPVYDTDTRLNINNYPTRITWSETKQNSAFIDSFRYTKPFDYKDFPQTGGEIVRIVAFANRLFSFQHKAVNLHLVKPKMLLNNDEGTEIFVSTTQILDQEIQALTREYGVLNPDDVFVSDTAIYFVDIMSGVICVVIGNRVEKLSINKKVSLLVSNYCKEIIDAGKAGKSPVKIGKDFRNNNIYFTFSSGSASLKTLIYSEYAQAFVSTFSSESTLYASLQNRFFSFVKNGDNIIGHEIGSLLQRHNKIYNKDFTVTLSFVINNLPGTKTLDNLQIMGTKHKPFLITYGTKEGNYAEQSLDDNDGINSNSRFKESVLNIICPLTKEGKRLRSDWFLVTLYYKADVGFDLYKTLSSVRISYTI